MKTVWRRIFLTAALVISGWNEAEEGVVQVIVLQHRPAEELQALIAPLLEKNETAITNGHSMIIKATSSRLPELFSLVKKLDKPLANLAVTVVKSFVLTAEQMNAEEHNNAVLTRRMQSFQADTRKLRHQQSRQVLQTLEGKSAMIEFGKAVPRSDIELYESPHASHYYVRNGYDFISSGIVVKPTLSGDNTVMLFIAPWSDDLRVDGSIDSFQAETTLTTELGQWIEIGRLQAGGVSPQTKYLRHRRGTARETVHILVKVEKAF